MGRDKALLPHPEGGSFLCHAARCALAVCDRVLISGRRERPSNFPSQGAERMAWLPDLLADRGPLGGVVTALEWLWHHAEDDARQAALLVLPVDMPRLSADLLAELVRQYREATDVPPRRVLCASFDGTRAEPLLAIYPLEVRAALRRKLDSPDRSLSRWLSEHPPQLCRLSPERSLNVNRPEDLPPTFPGESI
jgi:molybdopterin-guanine dinucleotide biosynthesis protein A